MPLFRSRARKSSKAEGEKIEGKIRESVGSTLTEFNGLLGHISEGEKVSKDEQKERVEKAQEEVDKAQLAEGERRNEIEEKRAELDRKLVSLQSDVTKAGEELAVRQAEAEKARKESKAQVGRRSAEYGDSIRITNVEKDAEAHKLDMLMADTQQAKSEIEARVAELKDEEAAKLRKSEKIPADVSLTQEQKAGIERTVSALAASDSEIAEINKRLETLADKVEDATAGMSDKEKVLQDKAQVKDEVDKRDKEVFQVTDSKLTKAIGAYNDAETELKNWKAKKEAEEREMDFELKQLEQVTQAAQAELSKQQGRENDLIGGLEVITGIRSIDHLALVEQGDKAVPGIIAEDLKDYNVATPERTEHAIYDRQLAVKKEVDKFAGPGSEIGKVVKALKGGKISSGAGQDLTDSTSDAWSEKAVYRLLASVDKTLNEGTQDRFYSLMHAMNGVDVEKFERELKALETNLAILKIYDRAADLAATGDIGAAKDFLESIQTKDDARRYGIPNTVRLPGVSEALRLKVEQEIGRETEQSAVKIYEERTTKLKKRIEKIQSKNDKKEIKRVNSSIYQLVAEINAVMRVAKPTNEEISKLTRYVNDLKATVEAKASQLGVPAITNTVSSKHMDVVTRHILEMVNTSSLGEKGLSANAFVENTSRAYDELIQIFSQAYGIDKFNIEETLDEYVKRQMALKKVLREVKLEHSAEAITPFATLGTGS